MHKAAGLRNAMVNTGLRGRWESLRTSPLLILDVAHNPDGIKKLREQLETVAYRKLFIILGMSKEKDVQAVLSLLPQEAVYGFTQAPIPRALEATELAHMAAQKNLSGQVFGDVNEAIETYLNQANEQDLILVCGSVFVVGEVDRDRFTQ
jgi:dihydrofolate synthase/folylpolyglutamate synthase